MAALALYQTHSFLSVGLPWLTRHTFLSQETPFKLVQPVLHSLLGLIPAIVLAVPKSKISHSRKSMRSANKGLKDKQNIVNCPACGGAKLAHHACRSCYDTIIAKSRQQFRRPSSSAHNI